MSVRALWVLEEGGGAGKTSASVLFSRRFKTVELREKRLRGEAYQPLPEDRDWADLIEAAYRHKDSNGDTEECKLAMFPPVYALGKYSPVIILQEKNYLVSCIPFVEQQETDIDLGPAANNPSNIAAVAVAVTLSEEIVNVVNNTPTNAKWQSNIVAQMHTYLSIAAPFGTVTTANYHHVASTILSKPPSKLLPVAQPAWKPALFKGKQTMTFTVHERVTGSQYDSEEHRDENVVTGTISCKAELEGVPDVSVAFNTALSLTHLAIHPCVQHGDTMDDVLQRKFTFSPPLDEFKMCAYRIKQADTVLPVRGFYQLKHHGSNAVKLLAQLKLHESVANHFEYCDVHIPLMNKGTIVKCDASPTAGTVEVLEKELIWHIGQRFPGRFLEVALPATVTFEHPEIVDPQDDLFCVEGNAFCELRFSIGDYSMSELKFDNSSYSIYPQTKLPKIQLARTFSTDRYFIWNSLKEGGVSISRARFCAVPAVQPLE